MILLELNGKFVILSEAKISLQMHKADMLYLYNWGLPFLWVAVLASSPSPSVPQRGSLVCLAIAAWQSLECLNLVQEKVCCYVELVLCSPNYCSTVPYGIKIACFQGATWKTGSDKNWFAEELLYIVKIKVIGKV